MKIFLAFAISAGMITSAAAGGPATPEETAAGFYGVYAGFHPSDGIPDDKGLSVLMPYLSEGLFKLLKAGQAAEAKFVAKNKDSPPLIEGDLFTSNFEGATSFAVRKCASSGLSATCAIALVYDPKDGRNKPVTWTDRLHLIQTQGGWRVEDIGYGGNWAFGNKGRLTETLKEAIGDAGS